MAIRCHYRRFLIDLARLQEFFTSVKNLRASLYARVIVTMHPLATVTLVISGTVMFVSSVFMATSTPIPLFESEDPDGVNFDYSGMSGNITLEEKLNPTRGWAVYGFGEYIDLDQDGKWDDCELVEISIWSQSSENSTNETNWENFSKFYQEFAKIYKLEHLNIYLLKRILISLQAYLLKIMIILPLLINLLELLYRQAQNQEKIL